MKGMSVVGGRRYCIWIKDAHLEGLTRCAEDILRAREAHFPAKMPENLRVAHEKNDETLECIYIGRRFKNDTKMTQ